MLKLSKQSVSKKPFNKEEVLEDLLERLEDCPQWNRFTARDDADLTLWCPMTKTFTRTAGMMNIQTEVKRTFHLIVAIYILPDSDPLPEQGFLLEKEGVIPIIRGQSASAIYYELQDLEKDYR